MLLSNTFMTFAWYVTALLRWATALALISLTLVMPLPGDNTNFEAITPIIVSNRTFEARWLPWF